MCSQSGTQCKRQAVARETEMIKLPSDYSELISHKSLRSLASNMKICFFLRGLMLSSGQLTTGSRLDTSQVSGSQGLYSPKVAGPHPLEWSEMHAFRSGTDCSMRCTSPKEDFTLTSLLAVSFPVAVEGLWNEGDKEEVPPLPTRWQ